MAPSDPTHGTTAGTQTGTQTGRSGVDTARDAARETGRDLRDDASRIADSARDGVRDGVAGAQAEASRQAKRGIERTADEVSHTAHALETAAGEFEDGSLQHQLLNRAASGLSDLSGTLRGKSIDQIAGDLANFGRRNPAAFLGGAALVGFAVARFARASHSHAAYEDRRYGGYRGARGAYGATIDATAAAAANVALAIRHLRGLDGAGRRYGSDGHHDRRLDTGLVHGLVHGFVHGRQADLSGGGLDWRRLGIVGRRHRFNDGREAFRRQRRPAEQGEAQCLIPLRCTTRTGSLTRIAPRPP